MYQTDKPITMKSLARVANISDTCMQDNVNLLRKIVVRGK